VLATAWRREPIALGTNQKRRLADVGGIDAMAIVGDPPIAESAHRLPLSGNRHLASKGRLAWGRRPR
jgi:hypothetical protein